MQTLKIGDVTITSIIERDGPWRRPEDMFPAYDAEIARRHLAELDREVFDLASGKMVITYQTYVVRTSKHTILIAANPVRPSGLNSHWAAVRIPSRSASSDGQDSLAINESPCGNGVEIINDEQCMR